VQDLDPQSPLYQLVFAPVGSFPKVKGINKTQDIDTDVLHWDKIQTLTKVFEKLQISKDIITSYLGSVTTTGEGSSRKQSFLCFVIHGTYNKTIYISPEAKTTYILHEVADIRHLEPYLSREVWPMTQIPEPKQESDIQVREDTMRKEICREKERSVIVKSEESPNKLHLQTQKEAKDWGTKLLTDPALQETLGIKIEDTTVDITNLKNPNSISDF
jgi:hypothetical protein